MTVVWRHRATWLLVALSLLSAACSGDFADRIAPEQAAESQLNLPPTQPPVAGNIEPQVLVVDEEPGPSAPVRMTPEPLTESGSQMREGCQPTTHGTHELCRYREFGQSIDVELLVAVPVGATTPFSQLTFVDTGGPWRTAEAATSAISLLVGEFPEMTMTAIIDVERPETESCVASLSDLHEQILEDTPLDAMASFAKGVANDCELEGRSARYFDAERQAVEASLDHLVAAEVWSGETFQVVGSSFAAARWQAMVPSMERYWPDSVSLVSPFLYGTDDRLLATGVEDHLLKAWSAALEEESCEADSCSLDDLVHVDCMTCVLERIESMTELSQRKVGLGLLAASFDTPTNVPAFRRLYTPDASSDLEDGLRRLGAAMLRQNVFGEVHGTWVTHLVGVCAAMRSGAGDTEPISAVGDALIALYSPCRYTAPAPLLQANKRPEVLDVSWCLETPLPDPVLGDGLSYVDGRSMDPDSGMNMQSLVRWPGYLVAHGDFGELKKCRPRS